MNRINVIGTSGSGKSTLGRALAERLGYTYVELDGVYHQPGWTPMPDDEFRAAVRPALEGERWVVDGNYAVVRDLLWERADTVVWLDVPRSTVMRQVIRRTFRRMRTGEELWNGNREHWRKLFDPRREENIILWAWTTYADRRRRYARLMEDDAWPHLSWVRLRSNDEVASFLASVGE